MFKAVSASVKITQAVR